MECHFHGYVIRQDHANYDMILQLILAAILGAIGRRIAGGILNQFSHNSRVMGDTPARILFGILVAVLPAIHDYRLLLFIPGIWAGTTISLFNSIGMGRGSDNYWRSFFGLSLHGIAGTILPAIAAYALGDAWLPLVIAGLLIAPCYTLGWSLTGKDGVRPSFPVGLQNAPEIGEALWGACVSVAAMLAVLS